MISIEMQDANDFVTSFVLNEQTYKLHIGWNDAARQWSMDVRTAANIDIGRGIAIVPNYPLLNQGRRTGLPDYEIMAVVVNTDSAENQTIGREDFISGKFALVVVPEAEINAIKNAKIVE